MTDGLGSSRGHAAAAAARRTIDDVARDARAVPTGIDRARLSRALTSAKQSLLATIDADPGAPAHLDGLTAAGGSLRDARAALTTTATPHALVSAVAAIDRAITELSVAEDELTRELFSRRAPAPSSAPASRGEPPFRASIGEPRLHARRGREPSGDVDVGADPVDTTDALDLPGPTAATSFEDLAARVARGVPSPAAPAAPPIAHAIEQRIDDQHIVDEMGRQCLEDIALLGLLRRPLPSESWLDQRPFEARILANLDAFASLGERAMPLVSLFHAEAAAPDAARAFAAALVLGSIDGVGSIETALAMVERAAPEERDGWTDGLALAPHVGIDAAMASLASSASPWAAMAIDVARLRGALPDGAIDVAATRTEPEIRLALARALGDVGSTSVATSVLERLVATSGDDDALFVAATTSLALRGVDVRPALRDAAKNATTPERRDGAIRLLGLAGARGDVDLLLDAAYVAPTPLLLAALGRFGHVETIGTLIRALRSDDEAVVVAASRALARVTGAPLWDTVLVPWHDGPDGKSEPLRRVQLASRDPARWEAWNDGDGRRLDARVRYRNGRPHSEAQLVDELESATPGSPRDEALLELRLVSGVATPSFVHDWVDRQRHALARLRASLTPASPGGWRFAGR